MEMYPDRAVDCDPLQHGDIMGSSQRVAESVSLIGGENISVKMISLVDERHHDSNVKRVLWRQMSFHHRLVMDLVPGRPEPGVLLVVQGGGHLHLLPHPPPHLLVVGSVVTISLHCK